MVWVLSIMLRLLPFQHSGCCWLVLVLVTRMFSEAMLELVPMSVVAWRGRVTMVSDNNLLLPPPYTEISRSANTNIIQTLEVLSYQQTRGSLSKWESVKLGWDSTNYYYVLVISTSLSQQFLIWFSCSIKYQTTKLHHDRNWPFYSC